MSRRIEIPPRDTKAPVRVPRAPESKPKKPSGVLNERHTSAQDPLYRQWIDDETTLMLTFDDGSALSGILRAFDTYALQLDTPDGERMLVFKQSLRWIKPA